MSRAVRVLVVVSLALMLCPSSVAAEAPDRQTQGFWALVHSIWAEGSVTWSQALAAADAAVSAIEAAGDVPVSAMEQVSESVSADVISLSGADDWLSDRLDVEQAILQYLGSGGPTLETRDGRDYWVFAGDHSEAEEILLGTYTVTGEEPLSGSQYRNLVYYTCVPSGGSVGSARIRARLQSTGGSLGISSVASAGGDCVSGSVSFRYTGDPAFIPGDVIEFYSVRTHSQQDFIAMISKTFEFRSTVGTLFGTIGDIAIDGISTWGDGWSEAGLDELWLRPKPSGYVDYDNLYPSGLSHFDYVMTAYCMNEDIETCYLYNGDLGGVWLRDLQRAPVTIYNLQYGYTYNITITSPEVDWDEGTEGTWGGLGQVLGALIEAIGSILATVSSGIVTIVTEIVKVPLRVVEAFFSTLSERAADLMIPEVPLSERLGEVVTAAQDKFPLAIVEELEQVTVVFDGAVAAPAVMTLPNLLGGPDYEVPLTLPENARAMMQTVSGAAFYLLYALYLFRRVRGFLRY